MAYRFETDEPVDDALTRTLREQIDKALAAVDDEGAHEAVHEVRKRCKKCRAVVRLVRKAFGGYAEANAYFRDIARPLATLREATAHLETLDDLVDRHRDALDPDAFGRIRDRLVERRAHLADDAPLDRLLEEAQLRLGEARAFVRDYAVDESGFAALGGGLEKTLRRCRARLDDVEDDEDPALFHEWRKRVKYHRYQLKLLRRAWTPLIDARRDEAHRLTDILGEHNDLVELRATIRREQPAEREVLEVVDGLGIRRERELRRKSRVLGRRLFAEPAPHYARRVEKWWRVAEAA